MYRFKYSNRRDYAGFFAKAAIKYNGVWLREIAPDIIIPVPMYPGKKRKRGYNQAEIFGRKLSKEIGIPCREDIIYRIRDTMPLKALVAAQRQTKLKEAFECRRIIPGDIRILLVDDIYTTGSTVDEISGTLIKSGAVDIYCLYICIGRKEESSYGS